EQPGDDRRDAAGPLRPARAAATGSRRLPRQLVGGKADLLTHARRFRLLASEIEIRTDCSLVDRELSYLVPGAAQDYPVTHRFAFDISRDGDRYLSSAEGEPVDSERSPNFVMFNLFSRVNGAAFSVMPAFIRLHSASGIYNGRRFLVVGDRAAGKTTLMLRL